MTKELCTLRVRNIEDELRKALKMHAVQTGVPQGVVLNDILRKYFCSKYPSYLLDKHR